MLVTDKYYWIIQSHDRKTTRQLARCDCGKHAIFMEQLYLYCRNPNLWTALKAASSTCQVVSLYISIEQCIQTAAGKWRAAAYCCCIWQDCANTLADFDCSKICSAHYEQKDQNRFLTILSHWQKRRASPFLSTLSCPPKIHKFDCQFSFLIFLRNSICQATVSVNRLWVVLHPDGMPQFQCLKYHIWNFQPFLCKISSQSWYPRRRLRSKNTKTFGCCTEFDLFSTLLCCFSLCNKPDSKISEQSFTSFSIDRYA